MQSLFKCYASFMQIIYRFYSRKLQIKISICDFNNNNFLKKCTVWNNNNNNNNNFNNITVIFAVINLGNFKYIEIPMMCKDDNIFCNNCLYHYLIIYRKHLFIHYSLYHYTIFKN